MKQCVQEADRLTWFQSGECVRRQGLDVGAQRCEVEMSVTAVPT